MKRPIASCYSDWCRFLFGDYIIKITFLLSYLLTSIWIIRYITPGYLKSCFMIAKKPAHFQILQS